MGIHRISWVGILVLAVGAAARGQVFVDNFEDGNDDGWLRVDSFAGAARPGVFDASSGEYNLKASNPVGGRQLGLVFSVLEESIAGDLPFSDGLMRMKVRADTMGTAPFLAMRTDSIFDDGYFFSASTLPEFGFNYFKCVGRLADGCSDNRLTGITPAPGEDWFIEAGTVGDHITMKVWRVGEVEPTDPQLRFVDNSLTSGGIGVGALIAPQFQNPVILDATFDDISFRVPEPSTALLSGLAFTYVFVCRRRKRGRSLDYGRRVSCPVENARSMVTGG